MTRHRLSWHNEARRIGRCQRLSTTWPNPSPARSRPSGRAFDPASFAHASSNRQGLSGPICCLLLSSAVVLASVCHRASRTGQCVPGLGEGFCAPPTLAMKSPRSTGLCGSWTCRGLTLELFGLRHRQAVDKAINLRRRQVFYSGADATPSHD